MSVCVCVLLFKGVFAINVICYVTLYGFLCASLCLCGILNKLFGWFVCTVVCDVVWSVFCVLVLCLCVVCVCSCFRMCLRAFVIYCLMP